MTCELAKRFRQAFVARGRENQDRLLRELAAAFPQMRVGWAHDASAHFGKDDAVPELPALVDACEAAAKLKPGRGMPYAVRGLARLAAEDLDAADEDMATAARLEPGNAAFLKLRGRAWLFAMSQYPRMDLDRRRMAAFAFEPLDEAVELAPRDAEAYLLRGMAHAGLEESDEAILDHTKALELDCGMAEARLERGILFLELGLRERCARDLAAAFSSDMSWRNSQVLLKMIFSGGPGLNYDMLQTLILDRMLERAPGDAELLRERAIHLLACGLYARAISDLGAVLRKTPGDRHALLLRGKARHLKGDHAGALEDLAAANGPEGDGEELYWCGMTYAALGRRAEALWCLSAPAGNPPAEAEKRHRAEELAREAYRGLSPAEPEWRRRSERTRVGPPAA